MELIYDPVGPAFLHASPLMILGEFLGWLSSHHARTRILVLLVLVSLSFGWTVSRIAGTSGRRFLLGLSAALVVVVLALLPWPLTALVALTVWTYQGVEKIRFSRLLTVLALRVGALVLAYLLLLRPSLAQYDDTIVPSTIIVLIDGSESMNITDEPGSQSRWASAREIINASAVRALLKKLHDEQKVEVRFYEGTTDGIRELSAEKKAEGKRSPFGRWLRTLYKLAGSDPNLRVLLFFSDGADNGTDLSSLQEAADWRRHPCPLHTFGLGSPTTSLKQQDLAFVSILPTPSPVPVKGKLTVRGVLNAPGFENREVNVQLLLDDKVTGPPKKVTLYKTEGNEVEMTCDAPSTAGEIKVTLKVDELPGEINHANNEISTYVTVTKEGISVLWVEGQKRAWESVFAIRHALSRDPRIRVFYAERLNDEPLGPGEADLFAFKKQHYDVIVIGDVSAKRFCGGNVKILQEIKELVRDKGTGVMMLGGYETFGNSDWQDFGADLVEILPVDIAKSEGQIAMKVQVKPTETGLSHYLLRLDSDPRVNETLWRVVFKPLDGITKIVPKKDAVRLAVDKNNEETYVLVGTQYGKGRTLAFAGDTTWKAWRHSKEAVPLYERFWKQAILWLARQEEAEGNVWVQPDVRRLPAGNSLGFKAGLRGKGGVDLKGSTVTVKVFGPQKGQVWEARTTPDGVLHKGSFPKTGTPGEYVIEVTGSGKDTDGKKVEGTARARFLTYADDVENVRAAADHEFLRKLALEGGGEFHRATESELVQFLEQLRGQALPQSRPRSDAWPDWRRNPASPAVIDQMTAAWQSGLLACFLLFSTLICLEWFLRRRWGMV
jgi:uncharacterized membrane protein